MVFHWSLSDSKSPQVSRTRIRILAVLSNVVVWIVSTRPPTSKSSMPFNNPLVIVPNTPITIDITVTFMFHSFFNSLARSRYLSFFSLSFRFILWSAGTAKSTILQILFFKFFTPSSAGGLSLESEWQQKSSDLKDSSECSGRFQQYCCLDGLDSSTDLQFLQSLLQALQYPSNSFRTGSLHWVPSNIKFPQPSRTLPNILINLGSYEFSMSQVFHGTPVNFVTFPGILDYFKVSNYCTWVLFLTERIRM